MVDSEYCPENYKFLKIRIEIIIKNPEMLRFISDYLETETMHENAVKKLPFIKRYVPDLYETEYINV